MTATLRLSLWISGTTVLVLQRLCRWTVGNLYLVRVVYVVMV